MHESVRAMWRAYLATLGQTPDATVHALSVWHFCDNQEDADACAQLVLQGRKRATAPSVAELEAAGESMPGAGDLYVIRTGQARRSASSGQSAWRSCRSRR